MSRRRADDAAIKQRAKRAPRQMHQPWGNKVAAECRERAKSGATTKPSSRTVTKIPDAEWTPAYIALWRNLLFGEPF